MRCSTALDREGYRLRLFVLIMVMLGIYFFVFGESGFLERLKLERNRVLLRERIEELKKQNAELAYTLMRYSKGAIGRDEFIKAGYAMPGARIIYLRGALPSSPAVAPGDVQKKDTFPDLYHLRILWGVISAMVVLIYMARASRRIEQEEL